ELRASIKSLLIWGGSMTLLIVVWMAEFSAFANNDSMAKLLESVPKGMLDAFGFESFNLSTLTGFMGLVFVYVTLILCIHAILKGNSIIAKEERDKTVEFTLVLPVKRSKIILAKLIAVALNCIILISYMYGVIIALSQKYLPEENFIKFFTLLILGTFILQMIFLSIGILLGCAMKQYKKSGYIGASLIIILYILSVFTDLNDKLDFLKYITPFKYFAPVNIKNDMALDWTYVIISLAIISISLTIGFITYKKRDLYI
ncbi:MAG: ABC transporter permease subunit, partial [Clostridiales bacterium]|nr:ABC transporter permease subunit [Clostridiales bacterium]